MRTAGNDGVLGHLQLQRAPGQAAPLEFGAQPLGKVGLQQRDRRHIHTHLAVLHALGHPALGGVQRIGQNQSVNLAGFALQLADQKEGVRAQGAQQWIVQAQKSLVVNLRRMQIDDGLEVQRETSAIQKPGEVVGNQREMHVVLWRFLVGWSHTHERQAQPLQLLAHLVRADVSELIYRQGEGNHQQHRQQRQAVVWIAGGWLLQGEAVHQQPVQYQDGATADEVVSPVLRGITLCERAHLARAVPNGGVTGHASRRGNAQRNGQNVHLREMGYVAAGKQKVPGHHAQGEQQACRQKVAHAGAGAQRGDGDSGAEYHDQQAAQRGHQFQGHME